MAVRRRIAEVVDLRPEARENCATRSGSAAWATRTASSSGTSSTVDRLVAAGGGGDQRGEAGAALEPGGAEVPADDVVDLQDPAAAVRRSRSGRRGGPSTRAWPRERVRSRASSAATGRATQAGQQPRRGDRASTADDARRRPARAPGSSARVQRRRAARAGRGRSGARRPARRCRAPRRPPARRRARGAGGTSERAALLAPARPVTIAESRAPPARRSPSGSERLTPATRSSSSVVSRVVNRPRVRCQVAALRGCGSAGSPSW